MSSLSKRLGWDDLKLVMAVAGAGNLAGAALEIGVNSSTIFRRLQQLETQLAIPLFLRHRSRYELTAAGMAIVELAQRVEEDIDGVILNLSSEHSQPKGELRLTTNDTLLFHVLMPMLGAFKARQPNIRVKVSIDNSPLSLSTSDSDVALRATDAPPANLAGRRMGRTVWGLYARESDFAQRTLPRGLEVFECNWVTLSDDLSTLAPVKFVRKNVAPERIGFAVNSVLALADAVEAGFGIGYLPCFVGSARPSLVRLEGPTMTFAHELWLLFHPHMRRSAVVREFVQFASQELSELGPMLEGSLL